MTRNMNVLIILVMIWIRLSSLKNTLQFWYFENSTECQGVPQEEKFLVWECYKSQFGDEKASFVPDCGREDLPGIIAFYFDDEEVTCVGYKHNHTSLEFDIGDCVSFEGQGKNVGSFQMIDCIRNP